MLGAEVIMEGRAEQSTPADAKPVFEAFRAAGVDEETAYDATYAIQDLGGWAAREALAGFQDDVEAAQSVQDAKFESLWTDHFASFDSFHTEFIAEIESLRTDIKSLAREVRHLRWMLILFLVLWTFWLVAATLGWVGPRVIVREIQFVTSESVQPLAAPEAAPPPAVTGSSRTQPGEEFVE